MDRYSLKEPIEAILIKTKEDFPQGVWPWVHEGEPESFHEYHPGDDEHDHPPLWYFGEVYLVKFNRDWKYVARRDFEAMFQRVA